MLESLAWCVLWFVVWALIALAYIGYLDTRHKALHNQRVITERLLEIRGEE